MRLSGTLHFTIDVPSEPEQTPTKRETPGQVDEMLPEGWIPVPNVYFDRLAPRLRLAEIKCLSYLMREALRQPERDCLKTPQAGIVRHLMLHVNTVATSLHSLESLGLIESRRVGRERNYRVLFERWEDVASQAPSR